MVRNLLCQVLKVIRHVLKSLTQKRVKGLCRRPFTYSQRRHYVNGDESVSANWILLFGGEIEQIIVLHRLSTLLEKTCGVIKVDGHSETRHIFTNHIFEDGPDAWTRVWIFQPRQSAPFKRLIRITRLNVRLAVFGFFDVLFRLYLQVFLFFIFVRSFKNRI